jgi:hypothetical protein
MTDMPTIWWEPSWEDAPEYIRGEEETDTEEEELPW